MPDPSASKTENVALLWELISGSMRSAGIDFTTHDRPSREAGLMCASMRQIRHRDVTSSAKVASSDRIVLYLLLVITRSACKEGMVDHVTALHSAQIKSS